MSSEAMTPCPADSELMKAWTAYEATEAYNNSLYWATTENRMRPERAEELSIAPEANRANRFMRDDRAKGALWAAFMAGFGAAGGKVSF